MNVLGLVWDSWWHLLLNVLVAINFVVHNPAVAIVVFTILIKLLTVPLTLKSLRSTRNMQRIQPLIKEVQKKYGKDKQKQQEETMRIYQQYGVNPAAGCFPMLVTLPIFFGLYSALTNTITHGADPNWLKPILFSSALVPYANFSQHFLWITNLAKPDPAYVLPLLSGVFQFIQSRMAMAPRDPNSPVDPQTKMMNNMMQFMPLYIIFISLNFPAGVVIYWAVSNIFSAVQQYFITGWGSLPNVPGLSFLPKKVHAMPEPLPPPPVGELAPRKGVFQRMMDKALEAQQTQQATAQTGLTTASGTARASASTSTGRSGVERVKKKGSATQAQAQTPRVVRATTVKYASDLRRRESAHVNGNGNGVDDSAESSLDDSGSEDTTGQVSGAAQLPRRKRNKR